jgi:YD repeat-containing protein
MRWYRRTLLRVVATALASLCVLHAQGSGVTYVYDETGRLVGVINAAGDAATYSYDAVGNLLSIARHSSGAVSIIEFTPNLGSVGTSVVIQGIGFSTTPASNTVTFNGVTASVSAAAATQLTVTVPSGATTGTIGVTSPSGSTTSATSFTVGASNAPTITSFTPTTATAGTAITISGTNFTTTLQNNRLKLNLTPTYALSGTTSTSLSTTVPSAAGSGRITVATPNGTVISTADLFVPPSPYVATDVQYTNRMAYGDSRSVAITTSGKIGLVVFDAPAGRRTSVKAVPGPNSDVSVAGPSGTGLASRATGISTVLVEPGQLPTAGTYTVRVDPVLTATGTVTITLYEVPADVTGTFTLSSAGNQKTAVITTPGQNARFTFAGTTGQRIALSLSGPNGTVSIRNASDTSLASASPGIFGSFIEPVTLATTETHSVFADALEEKTGTYTLTLYDVPADSTGTMTINGGTVVMPLTPGQNGSRTFNGTNGQQVTVRITNNIANTVVTLLRPDGTSMTSSSSIWSSFNLAQQTLPVTGTYTVTVNPPGTNSGANFTLAVTNP